LSVQKILAISVPSTIHEAKHALEQRHIRWSGARFALVLVEKSSDMMFGWSRLVGITTVTQRDWYCTIHLHMSRAFTKALQLYSSSASPIRFLPSNSTNNHRRNLSKATAPVVRDSLECANRISPSRSRSRLTGSSFQHPPASAPSGYVTVFVTTGPSWPRVAASAGFSTVAALGHFLSSTSASAICRPHHSCITLFMAARESRGDMSQRV